MSNVTAAASAIRTMSDESTRKRTTDKSLGQDDFLKILVAQMANQDPMSPTSNEDFLAQMAQFTMLEQIKEMSASFATTQAYSMIGKDVYIQNGDSLIRGKVDGVTKEDGINYLLVGGNMYDVTRVVGVVDSVNNGLDDQILKSADLIGKTITAKITAQGGTTQTVTGEVSKIMVKSGVVYAMVDGTEVPVANITEIAAESQQNI